MVTEVLTELQALKSTAAQEIPAGCYALAVPYLSLHMQTDSSPVKFWRRLVFPGECGEVTKTDSNPVWF